MVLPQKKRKKKTKKNRPPTPDEMFENYEDTPVSQTLSSNSTQSNVQPENTNTLPNTQIVPINTTFQQLIDTQPCKSNTSDTSSTSKYTTPTTTPISTPPFQSWYEESLVKNPIHPSIVTLSKIIPTLYNTTSTTTTTPTYTTINTLTTTVLVHSPPRMTSSPIHTNNKDNSMHLATPPINNTTPSPNINIQPTKKMKINKINQQELTKIDIIPNTQSETDTNTPSQVKKKKRRARVVAVPEIPPPSLPDSDTDEDLILIHTPTPKQPIKTNITPKPNKNNTAKVIIQNTQPTSSNSTNILHTPPQTK